MLILTVSGLQITSRHTEFHPEADGGIATKMDLIRLAPGKQSTERSTILTILVIWLLAGRSLMGNGIILTEAV